MSLALPALALLAVAAFGAAPESKPGASVVGPTKPAAAVPRADAELEKLIREKFAASKISKNNFQVRVQGGVATLTGATDVLQHKGTATRLARNAGAKRVDNRIEVSQEARDRASERLRSGRRRAQVKRSEEPDRK
ncbi:MAG: BON domain-containing protein [Bryobacterales bacterium]|nr:BON domain-containing protein [Bryobacterales bacterium]